MNNQTLPVQYMVQPDIKFDFQCKVRMKQSFLTLQYIYLGVGFGYSIEKKLSYL